MGKYWPIVFWMYDVSGSKILKYKPLDTNHPKSFYDPQKALHWGLRTVAEQQQQQRFNLQAMPTYIVKVIESKTKPDITASSTLRLFVERIPLNP